MKIIIIIIIIIINNQNNNNNNDNRLDYKHGIHYEPTEYQYTLCLREVEKNRTLSHVAAVFQNLN